MAADSREVSFLYFLFYLNSSGGFEWSLEGLKITGNLEALCETSEGGAQEIKLKGGTQQISKRLAEQIGMENIVFELISRLTKQHRNSTLL